MHAGRPEHDDAPECRPFRPGDLAGLAEIERSSFPSAWSERVLRRQIRQPRASCLVLELGDRIAGFFLFAEEPDGLHLINLAVHPRHRREGLASHALELLESMAAERGAARVVLEVRESNLAAQLLYRKAGYLAVEIVPRYYGNEDAYRMEKRLDPERGRSP